MVKVKNKIADAKEFLRQYEMIPSAPDSIYTIHIDIKAKPAALSASGLDDIMNYISNLEGAVKELIDGKCLGERPSNVLDGSIAQKNWDKVNNIRSIINQTEKGKTDDRLQET